MEALTVLPESSSADLNAEILYNSLSVYPVISLTLTQTSDHSAVINSIICSLIEDVVFLSHITHAL